MAVRSPARPDRQLDTRRAGAGPTQEGRAEQVATWLLVFLTALLPSLALGASAWALGVAR